MQRSIGVIFLVAAGFAGKVAAQAPDPGVALKVEGALTAPSSDKDGKRRGVSGMACLTPTGTGARECVLVSDEESVAERVSLVGDRIVAARRTIHISRNDETDSGVLGRRVVVDCGRKEKKEVGEFDGEGVAVAPGYVYVVASHACSRKQHYKHDSFLLTRLPLTADGTAVDTSRPAERSLRVVDLLRGEPLPKGAYGGQTDVGVNIEGLAATGDMLWFGLRTPVEGEHTWLLGAKAASLFATGEAPLAAPPVAIEVTLGAKTGVRDVAALSDGRLLVLAGPAVNDDVAYTIRVIDDPKAEKVTPRVVATLARQEIGDADGKAETAKAETLVVLEEDLAQNRVTALVLYDNIDEGGPRRHVIDLTVNR